MAEDSVIETTSTGSEDHSRTIKVLDKGLVRLCQHMGSDRMIVDAARVSYQQGTKAVQSDRHLIRYLMRNKHWTPFEQTAITFHVKLPIFVARQLMRSGTFRFNEISARYSVMKDEFYVPNPLRRQSESNRQGSSSEVIEMLDMSKYQTTPGVDFVDPQQYLEVCNAGTYEDYKMMLDNGVARELARISLPVSLYTEYYCTVNLRNLFHFLELRLDTHAQWEAQQYGQAMLTLLEQHTDFEYAIEAFKDYILDDPKVSKYEMEIIRQVIQYASEEGDHSPSCLTISEHTQKLIDNHSQMSKREKTESKLLKLLGLDE